MIGIKNSAVHPLIEPTSAAPGGEFDSVDPATIDFPDKTSPLEASYHATVGTKPEAAAEVFNLSKTTGQPAAFVADNLDVTKEAANIPSSQYFAEIAKKYPGTASFLSDPGNMAMAKDDIGNFAKIEKVIQDHGISKDIYNAVFPQGFEKFASKVIQDFHSTPLVPVNKIAGASFDFLTRTEGAGQDSYRPFLKQNFPASYGAIKGLGQMTEGLTTGENITLLAALSTGVGAAFGAASKATEAINLIASGGFSIMMAKDLPEIYKQMRAAYETGDMENAARLATLGAGQLVMSLASAKGAKDHAVDLAADHVSAGMESTFDQSVSQGHGKSYTEIGKAIAESKLADRSPETHREFVGSVVRGSDFESVSVPASAFETYFQSKNIDPEEMAKKLGVEDQLASAKERGGDISVPFQDWAGELAKTPHYEGLKNDIRFEEGKPTANEAGLIKETVGKQVEAAVKNVSKENPEWETSRQQVQDQFAQQLIESKAYAGKDALTQAEAASRVIERLAAVTGEKSPMDYLQKHPIEIVGGQFVPGAESLKQDAVYIGDQKFPGEPDIPLYNVTKAGHRLEGSTVSEETLKKEGLAVPDKTLKSTNETDQQLLQDGEPAGPRGEISFLSDKSRITLRSADPSTFMHEMSHYWLKHFSEFAASGKGTEQNVADWKVVKDYLGIKEDQKAVSVQQQEKFARAFEKYLYEGKAPSEGLRASFNKFRSWLTNVYKNPGVLGELTPEVRAVMDRMLATEEEIAFAERLSGLQEDYADLKLDPKIMARLDKLKNEAHESAVKELFNQQMEEISKENKIKLTTEAADARAAAEKQIRESEVQQSIRAVKENFNTDPVKFAENIWGGKVKDSAILARFDQLAEARGYESGSELAYKILQEPPVEKQVQALVDQHMEKFADLKNTDKIKEAAIAATHNEKSTEVMAREAAIFQTLLDEAQGRLVDQRIRAEQARLEALAAQDKAREVVNGLPVSDAKRFLPYFTAERNAAIRVKKALMDGDYAEAAKAKREQMLNHALVRESYAFKAKFDSAIRFFDKFANRGQDLKGIPYGLMRQIDSLLSRHGLADPRFEDSQTYLATAKDMAKLGEDPEEIAHRTGWTNVDGNWKQESLQDTVTRIQDYYRTVSIPPSVLTGSPMDYRKMRVSDFMDLKSAVRSINAVGRGYDNFLDENIKMDRREAAAKLREFIESNVGTRYQDSRSIGTKPGENAVTKTIDAISKVPDAAIPQLVNLYRLCDFLDAGKPDGLMKNLVYRPLLHAERGEISDNDIGIKEVNKMHDKFWKPGEFENWRSQKVHIPSLGLDLTNDKIFSIALNWGTETGRQRVMDGEKFSPEQAAEILSHMGKREWDYAQARWNFLDKYWSRIVATQEMAAGETPKKIAALQIETAHGKYDGGYYPLAYDPARSSSVRDNVDTRNALYKTIGPVAAHTDHGFTESRLKNYSAPIKLSSDVFYTHLQDVLHDLNYRQGVIDVNGFLKQRDTREAITNAIGLDGYRTIEKHLKWVASNQGENLAGLEKLLRRLRMGSTMAVIGLRPMVAPIFFTSNLINASADVGPVNFGNSIKDFLSNREENVNFVDSLSPRMKKSSGMPDRDMMDLARRFQGKDSLMQQFAFYPHMKVNEAVAYPLWMMTYNANLDGLGQLKAIDLADEQVLKTLGSGSILDQSMAQRGSEYKKVFTWWYSWAGTQFNRMWAAGKFAGLEYDKGNVGVALSVVGGALVNGVLLQGANENLWREFMRNSQGQNEEKKGKRIAQRMIMQGISYVPVVRDATAYGLGRAMGTHADLNLPFEESLKTMIDPLADMYKAAKADGSVGPRFWENTAKAAALGAGYPQYLNTLIFNFMDNLNGLADGSWRDLMVRKTKD